MTKLSRIAATYALILALAGVSACSSVVPFDQMTPVQQAALIGNAVSN